MDSESVDIGSVMVVAISSDEAGAAGNGFLATTHVVEGVSEGLRNGLRTAIEASVWPASWEWN